MSAPEDWIRELKLRRRGTGCLRSAVCTGALLSDDNEVGECAVLLPVAILFSSRGGVCT
jgi:hypothetical protein